MIVEINPEDGISAAAEFLSHIFYPNKAKLQRRAMIAGCKAVYRAKASSDPNWANSLQSVLPMLFLQSDEVSQSALRHDRRLLNDRLVAGLMALPLIEPDLPDLALGLPEGFRRTVRAVAEVCQGLSDESDPENVIKRCWTPSKDVLPAVSAMALLIREPQDNGLPVGVGRLFADPCLLKSVIARAKVHEDALLNSRVRVREETMVRFRLAA